MKEHPKNIQRINSICRYFSQSEKIPVILLYYEDILAVHPHLEIGLSTYHEFLTDFDTNNGSIAIAETKGHVLFGWLWISENSPYSILIGPIKTYKASDNDYIKLLPNPDNISEEDSKTLNSLIHGSPIWSYQQLYDKLAFLNFVINNQETKSLSATAFYADTFSNIVQSNLEEENYQQRELGVLHNNYRYERELLRCITLGDQAHLRELAERGSSYIFKPRYSTDEMRTLKDDFIITATLISRAAISGGLDMETALQLCDNYVMLAEQCYSMEQIHSLSGTMQTDYINRTAKLQLPKETPTLIIDCVNYISSNITTPITTQSVAEHFGKRREYLSTQFKQYTGYPISEFIMRQRVENAKALLQYTNIPLVQIGFHLCFSDQSHFQRVFKKYEGITPTKYRQKKHQES